MAEQAKLIIALTVLCLAGGMQLELVRTWGQRKSILTEWLKYVGNGKAVEKK